MRNYVNELRHYHQYYIDKGRRKTAACLWATAHGAGLADFSYGKLFWALNNGMHYQEDLGMDALKHGRIAEAETRLAEAWRLSIEPTALGAALVTHYREADQEKEARRVYETFRDKLQTCAREMPGDKRFPKKLAEWRKATGYQD